MSRHARLRLRRLVALLHTIAAVGCSAYSEGSSTPEQATAGASPTIIVTDAQPVHELAIEPSGPAQPRDQTMHTETEPPVDVPGVPTPIDNQDKSVYANLRLEHSARFDGYLTDDFGRALYMFVDDVAGGEQSACLADCALEWPPFSPRVVVPSPELDPADITRFHREDGAWQTTYKGHGLYYRASELGTREVTGDGVDKRWFVARDYRVFLAAARTFTPAGGMTMDGSFLTDGFGRTLYVCLDDQPSTALHEAISSCDSVCSVKRPGFSADETARTLSVPSVIGASDLVQPDGQLQLTYRGWPLYRYIGDIAAGSTEGHNDRAWRAIDPVSFGLTDE